MGTERGEMEDGVREEPNQCWNNGPKWVPCLRCVRCLVPVVSLYLLNQEESCLLQDECSLLLAGMLLIGLILHIVSLFKFLYKYNKQNKDMSVSEKSEVLGERIAEPHQTCQPNTGHLVFIVRVLLDGLVVSLLQEPVSGLRVSHIQGLISRLEAIFELITVAANNNASIEEQGLQINNKEDKVIKIKAEDRLKHMCTYMQDRVRDLRCLLQTQDQYGVHIASVQQELLENWDLLEDLHTKVTLQPEMCQIAEDPHNVLTDTKNLYTKLGLFQCRILECQVHLSRSMHLLKELENKQQALAQTMGLTAKCIWTKDLLQCNTQQFEKVSQEFTSLSQQTLTFVMHLQGLSVSKEDKSFESSDVNHVQPPLDPDPSPPHTPSSKFSLISLLCGTRRRK